MTQNNKPLDVEKEIDRVLKECVDMCADYVICYDTDKYIKVSDGRWQGEGPDGYYRRQVKALLQTICLSAKPEKREWFLAEGGVIPIKDGMVEDRFLALMQNTGYNQALSDYEANLTRLLGGK